MEKLSQCLNEVIGEDFIKAIISNPKKECEIKKVKITTFVQNDKYKYQENRYIDTKVYHKNCDREEVIDTIYKHMEERFKQLEIETQNRKVNVIISKNGTVTIKNKSIKSENLKIIPRTHNREKNYILPRSEIIPFLVELGVQSKDGKIIQSKYDKYKQINRFLEFIDDIFYLFDRKDIVNIIDFGCGKSYLTFAIYYYFTVIKKKRVNIIGLDLKVDVVTKCNELSKKYGYDDLKFKIGSIDKFSWSGELDLMVTLHACDVATDFALQKAIDWNAKAILSVPCCQHEVNGQLKSEILEPILKYGIIKERMAALLTDAIRASVLEENGYSSQILEFIDMEHTPKNLLIRAVKNRSSEKIENVKLKELIKKTGISPTIYIK